MDTKDLKELEDNDVRIHLVCNNIFLSLSLGFYLKGHLSAIDEADFIITDVPNLKEKYPHLPICVVGSDLEIPCSVYEMFSQLHDFYSRVNAKQAEIFHRDLQNYSADSKKHAQDLQEKNTESKDDIKMIEQIKKEKMQQIMQNIDPALSGQVELLFNELSKKIYHTINQNKNGV